MWSYIGMLRSTGKSASGRKYQISILVFPLTFGNFRRIVMIGYARFNAIIQDIHGNSVSPNAVAGARTGYGWNFFW
jgi:hypothetical protein